MTQMAASRVPGVPETPARLVFAGGRSSEARAQVVERTAVWRRTAALKDLAWWLLIPVVVWIPPHIPWVLLVAGLGAWRAFGHLREHRTLLSLHGRCPKCDFEQDFAELGRMGNPHKVHCRNCRWELVAEVARPAVTT